MIRAFTLMTLVVLCSPFALADRPITITIIHSNDLHAHVQPFSIRKKSYGGYARQATLIRGLRGKHKNVLLLEAGDVFQGTLYFNEYEGLADLAFMNAMRYDAMCVGNHEFDRGPATLGNFLRLANFPVLSANLNVDNEPNLKGLIYPSTVVEVGKEKVGIVGCTTPSVLNISSPGPNVTLTDLQASVQRNVDELWKKGIHKIFVLSHIGYEEDQQLARGLHHVGLIVGGHSHTPLGTPELPGWRKADGPYPTRTKDADGQEVLIVQAYEWSKVLGHITLDFDRNGKVKRVVEAGPIVVNDGIPEDKEIKALVTAFEKPIANLQSQTVGQASIAIPKEADSSGESLMADVIADAMLQATEKSGALAAFVNSGGVRAGLESGKITYGHAITVQPFGNTLVLLDLTGQELKDAIEEGIGTGGELNPSHGVKYRYDSSLPKGSRVTSLTLDGNLIDPAKTYRVTLLNFTANGGDAHDVLKAAKGARVDTGLIDLDALLEYLKSHNPLSPVAEGRIIRK